MSLVLRLRQHLPNGFCRRPFVYPFATLNRGSLSGFCQNFGQPARKEEEEEEEVEIDQRRLPADYDPATFDPTEHRSPPTDRVFRLVGLFFLLKNPKQNRLLPQSLQSLGFQLSYHQLRTHTRLLQDIHSSILSNLNRSALKCLRINYNKCIKQVLCGFQPQIIAKVSGEMCSS
ncbi:hypothetical protein L3X38_022411 [Prunus dulcis]|uniref:Uncharacterized protein n=1 Tax=Prunus dulcis TaxID=3755 RepID=A0AAD4VYN1_PRUDU|nr:hypothetical protein L3X38_022411 [Prunus dulcis]